MNSSKPVSYTHLDVYKRQVFEETFRGSLGSRERKEQEYPIPPLEVGQTVGPVAVSYTHLQAEAAYRRFLESRGRGA